MMNEPQEPGRSVAPMTATDLGLRNTFNCSFATTILFFFHWLFSIGTRGEGAEASFLRLVFDKNVPFSEESIRRQLLYIKEKVSTKPDGDRENQRTGD